MAALPHSEVEGDMLRRFEALSNMFKSEVEVLFGKEKENAKEDLERIQEHALALEQQLAAQREQASQAIAAIQSFVETKQAGRLSDVFAQDSACDSNQGDAFRLQQIVTRFLEVNSSSVRPELEEAERKILELTQQVEVDRLLKEQLTSELSEARKLKNQEERDLIEFKSLREKESELQKTKMEAQQTRCELEEIQALNRQLLARSEQQNAIIKGKSDKIIDLVRQLEQQGDQIRLLADENNTLRLELGRDSDYLKVVTAPSNPLSYKCSAGVLSEELQTEERQFVEDIRTMAAKFPGFAVQGRSSDWCWLQISRVSDLYRSWLHRFQDHQRDCPESIKVEFVAKTAQIESEWSQQDSRMREANSEFQESEKVHNRRWEEHRLKLVRERDTKVKQLLDQAEHSKSKAEQQLLLQQAKLFGQRIDTQLERAWEEQRKERDLRRAEHQQKRQEARQRIKEDSMLAAQRSEEHATAASRFVDMATSKLAAIEDAWLRKNEKSAALTVQALKASDLASFLTSVRATTLAAAESEGSACSTEPKLPAKGSQHTGLNLVIDQVEELLRCRMSNRQALLRELQEQSRQQLRSCSEKFIQKEASNARSIRSEEPDLLDVSQANAITGLLRMRQHRHLKDALIRQFQDYVVVLRICALASRWLLPQSAAMVAQHFVNLPPLPMELAAGAAGTSASSVSGIPEASESDDDTAVEGNFLYNSLCRCLLDRALKLLNELQREELLQLKRSYASEHRLALGHFCQLEVDLVDKAIREDIREYELQISARLLSESERQINESRNELVSQVSEDVAKHVERYRHQLAEEEQVVVRERRKWLMNRLVVLQSNGSVTPSDRLLLQRLRSELRVCESKIERYDNEFSTSLAAQPAAPTSSRPPSGRSSRPSSASRKFAKAADAQSTASLHQEVPASPRRAQPAATGEALPSPSFSSSRLSSPLPGGCTPASPKLPLPQFGGLDAGTSSKTRTSPDFGQKPLQQPPLYDWPFEQQQPAAPTHPPHKSQAFTSRNLSAPAFSRLKPLESLVLQPQDLDHKIFRPAQASASELGECGGSALSKLLAGSSGRNRSVPPLLPPVPLTAR
jgi:hypothetical protein